MATSTAWMNRPIQWGRPLTTGQAARLCCVAPRTVVKWCDSGKLKHFKVPGSLDRRIYPDSLYQLMVQHGMRVPPELQPPGGTLVYGLNDGETVPGGVVIPSAFVLGTTIASSTPAAVVVGDGFGLADALDAITVVRSRHPLATLVLVVSADVTPPDLDGVRVLRRPVPWEDVARACENRRMIA